MNRWQRQRDDDLVSAKTLQTQPKDRPSKDDTKDTKKEEKPETDHKAKPNNNKRTKPWIRNGFKAIERRAYDDAKVKNKLNCDIHHYFGIKTLTKFPKYEHS
eukprot:194046_1